MRPVVVAELQTDSESRQPPSVLCRINGLTSRTRPEPPSSTPQCTTPLALTTALCCAAARSDRGIRENTLRHCTALLLLLSPTRCESAGVRLCATWLSRTASLSRTSAVECGSTICRSEVAATDGGTASTPTASCSSACSTRRWLRCHATTTSVPTATSASVVSPQPAIVSTSSLQLLMPVLPHRPLHRRHHLHHRRRTRCHRHRRLCCVVHQLFRSNAASACGAHV